VKPNGTICETLNLCYYHDRVNHT